MKSLECLLWQCLLEDLSGQSGTSTSRDVKTATARFEHEGLSFFTITLPGFAKDLLKGLERGRVDHDLFSGFHFASGLPRFLGGFLDLVFDRNTGVLLDDPSEEAIFNIRQICLFYSKLELPCSDARERVAFDEYVECELEIKGKQNDWSEVDYLTFRRVAFLLFREAFQMVDEDVYYGRCLPKHGPGATAERLSASEKYYRMHWTDRLEGVFPSREFLIPNEGSAFILDGIDFREPGDEMPVRVISVPKTLEKPRIIAIEPACMMYAQQAILERYLVSWKGDHILSEMLGFDNQVPNQQLARIGSIDGSLATLDLSEASDRVSNQLVRELLHYFPHFAEAVDACRSRKADVPGHGVIRLSKFASMGSALCFPFEAMVFLTCIFIGIEKELNTPLTRKIVRSFLGRVRVFGDDIIVPKEYVSTVVESLEHFGAKVNRNKSFWNSEFRESCGKEFFRGYDVSVVKCRRLLPLQRRDTQEILSMSSMRNQLYQLGLWKTCAWIDEYLVRILRKYPVVLPTSPAVGRHSFLGYQAERMDEHLHRPLVRAYKQVPVIPIDPLDQEGALLKFFLKRSEDPYQGDHLQRSGRAKSVNLKLGWISAV